MIPLDRFSTRKLIVITWTNILNIYREASVVSFSQSSFSHFNKLLLVFVQLVLVLHMTADRIRFQLSVRVTIVWSNNIMLKKQGSNIDLFTSGPLMRMIRLTEGWSHIAKVTLLQRMKGTSILSCNIMKKIASMGWELGRGNISVDFT